VIKRIEINLKLIIVTCVFLLSCLCLLPSTQAESSGRDAKDMLTSYLVKNYPWKEFDISSVHVVGTIPGGIPEKIIVEKGPVGRAVFSFLYKDTKKIIVRADVSVYEKVVKSKRPFKKGHVIESSDIYITKMDIRKMPNSSVKDPKSIIGKTLKRSIIANIPIVEDMVEQSQVVKRGKMVLLTINYKGLNITASGMTKEKGYVGMPVRAVNLSSKKMVTGILINQNTVKVEL
jgi:flagella basal body P-ring formation protein FlgA